MRKHIKNIGKAWRNKRMQHPKEPEPRIEWRDDGLTNHERVLKQRAEKKLKLERLKREADLEEMEEIL